MVNGFWSVISVQILVGSANAVIAPGLVGLSLGVVGRDLIAKRIGRNESFNFLGNMLGALVSVFIISYYHLSAIFYLIAGLSVAATLSVLSISSDQVNWLRARDSNENSQGLPIAFRELLRNKPLIQFMIVFAIYQFANASLLPIAVQMVAHRSSEEAARFLSLGVMVAQFVAVPTAFLTGLISKRFSPFEPLFLGLAAIVARVFIFSTGSSSEIFIFAQAFDGVAAGIIAVCPILIISVVTVGSGRFTFSSGILACAITVGASVSNVMSGYITEEFGPTTWFALAGFSALILFIFLIGTIPQFRLLGRFSKQKLPVLTVHDLSFPSGRRPLRVPH
jgi:MFS family permease